MRRAGLLTARHLTPVRWLAGRQPAAARSADVLARLGRLVVLLDVGGGALDVLDDDGGDLGVLVEAAVLGGVAGKGDAYLSIVRELNGSRWPDPPHPRPKPCCCLPITR